MFKVPYSCIVEQHDIRLVALAAFVCIFGCFTAVNLMVPAREATGRRQFVLLSMAAVVFGAAVWTTHFIAELAFKPGLPVAYDTDLTTVSLVVAISVAWLGMLVAVRSRSPAIGGFIIGAAVGAMHYVGMAAMRVPADASWNIGYVIASVATGVTLAAAASYVAWLGPAWRYRFLAAVLLVVAICGLHFIAMAAIALIPNPSIAVPDNAVAPELLAVLVAAATIGIVILAIATETLKALRRAECAEALLRDAVASISEGFVIYDRDDRFVMCNDAYRRLFPHSGQLMVPGTPYEEIVRANIAAGTLTVPLEAREEWITKHLKDHQNAGGAVELQLNNGQWLLVTDRRMRGGGIAGLRIDISKLKATEAQLRHSKDTLARAQRLAKMGSFEHDLRTGEVACSEEMYRMFGWDHCVTPPPIRKFLALIHPDDRAAYEASVRAAKEGLPTPAITYRMQCQDGSIKWMYTELDLIRDEQGTPIRRIGITRDVTEIRAAQERERDLERQLLHSQKLEALGTLAGGVAHDLNNTLVPILALATLARDELPEENALRGDLETIVRASERARDLVRQILAFSRKQDLARQAVDLARVTREALQMLRASVPATIQIVDQILEVPPLLGDPSELHQVIVNLVTNAAQAVGGAVGRITVRLWAAAGSLPQSAGGATISLSVVDTGCGMDEATVERIFEPFFTTRGVGEGTGLGLSVVHGIVKRHSGTITVRSAPGEGSEFTLSLPAAHHDEMAAPFVTAAA